MRPEKARGATSRKGSSVPLGAVEETGQGSGSSQGRHPRPKPPSLGARRLPTGCTREGRASCGGGRAGGLAAPGGGGESEGAGDALRTRKGPTEGPRGTQPDALREAARQARSRRRRSDLPGSRRRVGSVGSTAPGVGTQPRPASGPRFKAEGPTQIRETRPGKAHLAGQPPPPRRSRPQNATAASRAARPRLLIGPGRRSQKPPRAAPPIKLYGDPRRRTGTGRGRGRAFR